MSRRGNVYKSFVPLRDSLRTLKCEAVLDGEIVVLDGDGRAQFYDLLRRRGEPVFYAFDCLMRQGRDLRSLPLIRRKKILERIVSNHLRILFARHFERDGCALFNLVCDQGFGRDRCEAQRWWLRRGLVQNSEPDLQPVRRAARIVRETWSGKPILNQRR